MDAEGNFVRGDVLGLLSARFLGVGAVVTPVTSNSAIERTGYFAEVIRTRVGSPFVVEGLGRASGAAIGFEANGGTLVGRGIELASGPLAPLETRDAVLPILCALGLAARDGRPVHELVAGLPLQVALADRLQGVPTSKSQAFLSRLTADTAYAEALFCAPRDRRGQDGRRPSVSSRQRRHGAFPCVGQCAEMRCYVEGSTGRWRRHCSTGPWASCAAKLQ